MRLFLCAVLSLFTAALLPAAKPLNFFFVDVEGGQATVIVTPSGEALVVDAGWSGNDNRDADRIVAVAKKAGAKKIDFLIMTHYHADHVGGVPQLAAKMPIKTFVDHGDTTESGRQAENFFKNYAEVRAKGQHIVAKAGDSIPVKGIEVRVLSARGETLAAPLPGAGAVNPACAAFLKKGEDKSENARSVGTLYTYGKFRLIDLGDLTWNKEFELACPNNKIGTVDVYLTTHHGLDQSGPAALVHAMGARVAIMNNGAKKGGSASAMQVVRATPGFKDLWQIHYSLSAGKENNSPDTFIANIDEACEGKYIKVSAMPDGSFTVTNSRNNYSKTYQR